MLGAFIVIVGVWGSSVAFCEYICCGQEQTQGAQTRGEADGRAAHSELAQGGPTQGGQPEGEQQERGQQARQFSLWKFFSGQPLPRKRKAAVLAEPKPKNATSVPKARPTNADQDTAQKKGGRPPAADGAPKTKSFTMTGQQRKLFLETVQNSMNDGMSLRKSLHAGRRTFPVSESAAKKCWRNRSAYITWCQENHREAKRTPGTARLSGDRSSLRARESRSRGCRLPGVRGYLGKVDHVRPIVQALEIWKDREQEAGHTIHRPDLVRRFRELLDSAISFAEQETQAADVPEVEEAALRAWKAKAAALVSKQKRDKYGKYLLAKTGLVERAKQRQTPLTVEQEKQKLETGWQVWDSVLWKAAFGETDDLKDWVANPERWRLNRESTVVLMSDQVPVWLMPDAGKVCVSRNVLQAAQRARKDRTRRSAAVGQDAQTAAAAEQAETLVKAPGNPANSRSRYTLVARQAIHDVFSKTREPTGSPRTTSWNSQANLFSQLSGLGARHVRNSLCLSVASILSHKPGQPTILTIRMPSGSRQEAVRNPLSAERASMFLPVDVRKLSGMICQEAVRN